MTPQQQSDFAKSGFVLFQSALAGRDVAPLRQRVLDELKRLRLWSGGKLLSASLKSAPAFQQIAKVSAAIPHEDLPARLTTPDLQVTIHTLLAGRRLAPAQGQFLVSLPNQGAWRLAGLNWHTDVFAASAQGGPPGIQLFALLDDVQPHGGATLAIAGSHRLAGEARGRRLRELLRAPEDPVSELRAIDLSIVEMSGRAGDVYLMDMRVLHSPSINASNKLRMMATVRYLPAA